MAAYDNCPPIVQQSDPFKTKLEASAPYEYVDDNVVEVKPVADKNDPFIKEIRDAWGSHDNLTPLDGTRPLGASTIPGWRGQAEYDERLRLRKRLRSVYQQVKGSTPGTGPIHPQAKGLLHSLTYDGTQKLNQIRAIYDKWKARRLPSIYAGQTVGGDAGRPVAIAPDGRQPLSLAYSVDEYRTWLADMTGQQRLDWLSAAFWPNLAEVLEGAGLNLIENAPLPSSVSATTFYNALIFDQWRDRNAIRQLLREVYRILYCVEYGVAQSESFYANKAQYLAGPGGKAPPGGLAQPPAPPPGIPIPPGGLVATLPEPPDPFEPPPPLPEPFGLDEATPGLPSDHPCTRAALLKGQHIHAVATGQHGLAAALLGQLAAAQAQCELATPADDFPPDQDAASDSQDALFPDAMDLLDEGDDEVPWYRTTVGRVALIGGAGLLAVGTTLVVQHVRKRGRR